MKMDMMVKMANSKNLPSPKIGVILSGILLLLGGLGIIFGVMVEWALGLLVFFLITVSFTMHRFWSESNDSKMIEMVNFMKNMALAGAALALYAVPLPWVFSLGI